jgi:hypothetical protein
MAALKEEERLRLFRQLSIPPESLSPQTLKERGNKCFKDKNYDAAVQLYTQGKLCNPHSLSLVVVRTINRMPGVL